ncbi:DMT family transporter [Aquabacter sp. L1I39]|uniref:DMT family transporter n=1 Tax=Aquabacter sp. L1I39 TaxID=2820278 RepID=UPI001ADB8274|nr:DMT family transporter [Aquabacter sp. L1I39]QTL01637.1 DMT family transporter [Aquabacter sp. L1I39]
MPPRSLSLPGLAFLFTTATGWGVAWVVFKIILFEWPPLFARGMAGVTAACLLAATSVAMGQSLAVPSGARFRLAVAAFVNVFVWMGFASLSLQWLTVTEATLITFTMPLWASLIAWPALGERPSWMSASALAMGFSGIALLVAGPGLSLEGPHLPAMLLPLTAAVLFALGSVMARTPLPLPPIASVAWQTGLGCLPMVVIALIFERQQIGPLSLKGLGAMAYMTLIPMAVCYLSWFAALRRLPASTAALGMLLVPIVGTTGAALVLGEPLGPRQILAFALVISGVALGLRARA